MTLLGEHDQDVSFKIFKMGVTQWMKGGSWEKYRQDKMEKLRDNVRELLGDRDLRGKSAVKIGRGSAIDDTLPLFLPRPLTHIRVIHTCGCDSKKCQEMGHEFSVHHSWDCLHIDGAWLRSTNVQQALERIVTLSIRREANLVVETSKPLRVQE